MEQPNFSTRKEYNDIVNDTPTLVAIPNTKRVVKVRGVKPYTLECLTALWLERDKVAEDSSETLRDLCKEPYFAVKEALLFVLNSYWKIRLLYPIMWRIWGKLRGYTEAQMTPIILEGKKKLPLMAHWKNMVFSVDMRTDWMKMTKKEAEQYQAERISAMKQLSLKHSPATGETKDSSSV